MTQSEPEFRGSQYVSRKVAATYLGLAEQTLNNDQVTGKLAIPFYRFGRAIRYLLDELDRWAAARKVEQ